MQNAAATANRAAIVRRRAGIVVMPMKDGVTTGIVRIALTTTPINLIVVAAGIAVHHTVDRQLNIELKRPANCAGFFLFAYG